ncbi:CPP1-like family protein [Umezakia ovalisporum]|jgi:hypothetical protein|uniref:CPP1-like family protein n=2 Tax=Umezakia ovalisporum TaxID=75695 RepID=A0AA43KEL1_9CYAN|nr:CPP1-like family protein [Umezakia ovalisporum]MBI1240358.1 molecular chaperone DnaJ [Nostoc sp. RI_552]MDH6058223.1 CPP1-like family protein [Umezakia ovalisporum FSS-43]MDH6063794.1 CPP1-like family protein [Umezakia ovalisporum FSS-62]MDH6066965.1 CPP1-like family protein [Umezakia ovalisporum APH033B]MDH6072336.1 CPP1-like family protein [Umezakia ovalisporum CobakiLakeA]
MSDQNPYEKLGVSEDASFDEIQEARNRQLERHIGDAKTLELIEVAYDAILMDRLRMRQEGKIKVPERIRFPELRVQLSPKENSAPREQSPPWLQRVMDKPAPTDILLPGAWYLGLSAVGIFAQSPGDQVLQLILIVGTGISIYFLQRKEGKFGRAILLTLVGLIVGLILGGLLAGFLLPQINFGQLSNEQFSTILTFTLLWLISSFLR